MPRSLQPLLLLVILFLATPLQGQTDHREALAPKVAAVPAPANKLLTVKAGERLFLQLETPLNTQSTRVGDRVEFKTTEDTLVDGFVAIARGSSVSGTVSRVRRPGRLKGRAEIGFSVDQLTLADGTSFPLKVRLLRAGFTQVSANKGEPSLKGEGGTRLSVISIAEGGIQGAVIGGAFGGAVGLGIGFVSELVQRGPDLDLPGQMAFEAAFRVPLDVTAAAARRSAQVARNTLSRSSPGASFPADRLSTDSAEGVPDFSQDEQSVKSKSPVATNTTGAVAAATNPRMPRLPGDTQRTAPVFEGTDQPDEFKLKVDVQLVMVDAVVRERTGRTMDNLQREDFRIFENGIEQLITSFSRDKLPLAVALVVDRSGSVALSMRQLRRAAYETLSQLKPDDRVALFAFTDQVEKLEDLTADRQRIADRIATIEAGGGTNINDALFEAIRYLSLAAHDCRRAVILISDNQATTKPRSSERKLIRLATQSQTVVYSIRIATEFTRLAAGVFPSLVGAHDVEKVTLETGGEIVDVPDKASLRAALAAVVSQLKLSYALGYQPSYAGTSDAFRKIDVRLSDRFGQVDYDYSVRARRGYYPSIQRVAAQNRAR
jgi:Ca-activated chloride channel homolog